jgi:hypothetical protein
MSIFELLGHAGKEEVWLRSKTYTDPEVRPLESGFWKIFRIKTLVMRSLDPEDTDRPKLLEGDLLKILKTLHQNAGDVDSEDFRDKVYGQLGLLDRRIFSLVTVSYAEDKSFMQVMADLAIAVIKGVRSLDWIHCTWSVALEKDEWPSWVPDFRVGKDGHHYRWASQAGDARKSPAEVEIDAANLILRCQGYHIDVLTAATQSLGDVVVTSSTQDAEEIYESALAYLNWEDHPGQPDRVSGPAIIRKKIHHASQLKNLSPPEIIPSQSHNYNGDDGLRDALRAILDRIG